MSILKHSLLFIIVFIIIFTFYTPISNSSVYKAESITDAQGCTYWITKSSGKRHNSSCRWYKKSKGYCTDEKIGTACKICGG